MAQISYGTITITDTTDIESIVVEYARNQSTSSAPDSQTGGWSTTRPAWAQGYYIWQRTRIHKSGTDSSEDEFGTAVCITGSTGQTGAAGRSLTATETKYANVASGTTQTQVEALAENLWISNVPSYDSSKPDYWIRVKNTYDKAPTTEYIYYKDNATSESLYNSAMANSIAQSANENANGALSQSEQALRRVQAKYGASSTAAATAAKVAACEGFELFNGAEVFIQFADKNTVANPTLNVNNTGAKPIKDSDGNNLAEQFYWKDNSLVHFVYDGTNWRILDIVTTEKYNNLVSDIDGVSRTVGQHTEQISGLGTRVSTNETNISQTATSITSLVSNQDTYTAPDGTTKTNTIKSAIKQNADNISLRVEKNGVIAAINASTESSGGSAVKISADKVNIEGAAIFTSGRLSTTNLNNTIDGRIPNIPDDLSDLTDNTGIIPDVSGLASKSSAVAKTQQIYYRSNSSTKPTSYPTVWVTSEENKWNNGNVTESNNFNGWRRKVTPISSGPNDNTKYLYLWTATQKQLVNGNTAALTANDIALDDSTTVIDGGKIITGSIDANSINATSINASGILTIGAIDSTVRNSILNSELTDDIAAAEANASYSVEIEVSSINFVNNNATLVAHPYFKGVKLTSSTTPALNTITGYSWSRADGTAIPSGVTTNAKTLQLPDNSDLNATYVCVISKP